MRRRRPGDGHDLRAAQLTELDSATAVEAAGLASTLGSEPRLVLALFWTSWCEPCRELRPQLERLAAEYPELCRLLVVDGDQQPDLVASHRVGSFPTLLVFKSGQELHRFKGGALPPSVLKLIGRS